MFHSDFFLFTFQLYGSLPFDDCDHKKLLKQVQSRITFPAKPKVSENCRILMMKILSRVKERVPLKNIKADAWFKTQQNVKKVIKAGEVHDHNENPDDLTKLTHMEEAAEVNQ